MPRRCTVCDHPQSESIDGELISGRALRTIAVRWSVSKTSLIRHRQSHIPEALAKAKDAQEIVRGDSLLDRLRQLNAETQDVLRAAKSERNHELRLKAIGRAEKQLELEGKLLGELNDGGAANINIAVVAPLILQALEAYPEARVSVARALKEIDK